MNHDMCTVRESRSGTAFVGLLQYSSQLAGRLQKTGCLPRDSSIEYDGQQVAMDLSDDDSRLELDVRFRLAGHSRPSASRGR